MPEVLSHFLAYHAKEYAAKGYLCLSRDVRLDPMPEGRGLRRAFGHAHLDSCLNCLLVLLCRPGSIHVQRLSRCPVSLPCRACDAGVGCILPRKPSPCTHRSQASTLHAAKAACLLLVAVYIVCLGAVIAFGTAMAYGLLVAFMGYMQAFLRFAPVFIGAILGIRMADG